YDNHGEFLGFMKDRSSGEGMVTIWKDDLPKYTYTKDIGRIEKYNIQALHKMTQDKQKIEIELCKCSKGGK
ncbi:MAG: hypothetical protein ACRCX2_16535, partial [Paraclostridium sp.]